MKLVEKHLHLITTKSEDGFNVTLEDRGCWDIPDEIDIADLIVLLDAIRMGEPIMAPVSLGIEPMGPCVERETVTGKWVAGRGFVCANCNQGLLVYQRFCPNCGGRISYEEREDAPKAVLD